MAVEALSPLTQAYDSCDVVTVNKTACPRQPICWLNDIAWNNKGSTERFFFLLVFKTTRAMQCVTSNAALLVTGFGRNGSWVWIASLSGSIGATGVIRIVALVVKYLDRSKTNYREGISQECFH